MSPSRRACRTALLQVLLGAYLTSWLARGELSSASDPCTDETCREVTILFTGSLDGRLLPVNTAGATCDPDKAAACFGGTARRIQYLRRERLQRSLRNETVFAVDLGGSSFGGPLYGHPEHSLGAPETELMNLVPYDFCTFSNRDFLGTKDSNRAAWVHSFVRRTCPMLLSNVKFKGAWEAFQQKLQPWAVRATADGLQVGFVGMMPYGNRLGFINDHTYIEVDSTSLLSDIMNGSFLVRANLDVLRDQFQRLSGDFELFSPDLAEVMVLSTLVPQDVLIAAQDAKAKHPDVDLMVLLVSTCDRDDQLKWLAEYGPFDVVLRECAPSSLVRRHNIVRNKMLHRNVVIATAGGSTFMGFSKLSARVRRGAGIVVADVTDIDLNSSFAADPAAQATMSALYNFSRTRNTEPFGRITNSVVGAHRVGETPPSARQCYYTECNAGWLLGRSLLDQARRLGYRADVSLSNLGAFRQTLTGTQGDPKFFNGTVFMQNCLATLKFQNTIGLFKILGSDLYAGIKGMLTSGSRGLPAAGVRVAFHEPCYGFVNHSVYASSTDDRAPGSPGELAACRGDPEANVTDPRLVTIDMEVAHVDFDRCLDWENCAAVEWRRLQMGTVYTIVTKHYLQGLIPGLIPLEGAIPNEPQNLCEYIAAHTPLNVPPWTEFYRRGQIQYSTPQAGWQDGANVVSVATSKSELDDAPQCPGGMYLPRQATACMKCPAGTHSTEKRTRAECDPCPLGLFNAEPGKEACTACRKGFFAGSVGATACSACPPGSFSEAGAIYCNRCQPGYVAPEPEAPECDPCGVGTYTPNFAAVSCASCPLGQITRYRAAVNLSACECKVGSYLPEGAAEQCVPCPAGMDCPAGSVARASSGYTGSRPVARPGYMTLASDPLEAYKCVPSFPCPGGSQGQCSAHNDVSFVACGRCKDGAYMGEDGICVPCDGSPEKRVAAVVLVLVVALLVLPCIVNRDIILQSRSSRDVATLLGTGTFALQICGTFDGLSFTDVGPIAAVAHACRGFTLDVKFLRLECTSGIGPAGSYALAQAAPLVSFLFIVVVITIKKCVKHNANFCSECTNTIGTICQLVFIAILYNCIRPLVCYAHPGGSHSSLRSYPSVLCFESREHERMLWVGAVSFFAVPLPFVALNVVAILKYPKLITRGSGIDFLKGTKFLFTRFRPTVFYYGCVLSARSLSFCLVPILFRDKPAVQLWATVAIFSLFLVGQQTLRPWNSDVINIVDGVLSAMLVLLVLSGASQDLTVAAEDMNIICNITAIMTASVVFLPVVDAIVRSCRSKVFYSFFVCHHKVDAAAQSRLLKMLLDKVSRRPTFLDSDHLQDLDLLFDIVKFKTGALVVYLTRMTLTRPWCVSEITSAHACNVPVVAVVTPSFAKPTSAQLKGLTDYVDFTGFKAAVYGISLSRMSEALAWFCGSIAADGFEVNMEYSIMERCHSIVEFLWKRRRQKYTSLTDRVSTILGHQLSGLMPSCSPLAASGLVCGVRSIWPRMPWTASSQTGCSPNSPVGSMLVSADPSDDEAVAGAYIVMMLLAMQVFLSEGSRLKVLSDGDCYSTNLKDTISDASGLIVILSAGTLRCLAQLRTICEGMTIREKLDKLAVVTAAFPNFSFLSEDALDKVLPSEFLTDPNKKLQVTRLFKLIACPLGLHESSFVLSTQCDTIRTRIQSFASKTRPSSPKPSGRVESAPVSEVAENDPYFAVEGELSAREPPKCPSVWGNIEAVDVGSVPDAVFGSAGVLGELGQEEGASGRVARLEFFKQSLRSKRTLLDDDLLDELAASCDAALQEFVGSVHRCRM